MRIGRKPRDVLPAFAELRGQHGRVARLQRGGRRRIMEQRGDDREVADAIDEEAPAFAGDRDDDSSERRADEAGNIDDGRVEGDGVAEIALSSTISTMNDWRPGISKALMSPWNTLSARISAMVMTMGERERSKRERLEAARACVQTSTLALIQRSTQTPAKGASRKVGIWPVKPTMPSSHADPVSR